MSENIITQSALDESVYLNRVEIGTNEIHSYPFDLINNEGSVTAVGTPKGRPDWSISFWISENDPAGAPLTKNFVITYRSNYSLVINGTDIDLYANQAKVTTIGSRLAGRTYYLNIHNLEGQDNIYIIKTTSVTEYLIDQLENRITDSGGNYIIMNT